MTDGQRAALGMVRRACYDSTLSATWTPARGRCMTDDERTRLAALRKEHGGRALAWKDEAWLLALCERLANENARLRHEAALVERERASGEG